MISRCLISWCVCLIAALVEKAFNVFMGSPQYWDGLYYEHVLDCRLPEKLFTPANDSNSLQRLHVVFAATAKGFSGLLASMTSLARHLTEPDACSIHVIVPAEDLAQVRHLAACFHREIAEMTSQPQVTVHEGQALSFDTTVLRSNAKLVWQRPELAGPMNWVRISLDKYLPNAPRAIWLDIDVIVKSDVAPLYRMHLDHALAVAPEGNDRPTLAFALKEFEEQTSNYSLRRRVQDSSRRKDPANITFFNPGVMVVDLARWRLEGWGRRLENLAELGLLNMLAMNVAAWGDFQLLDPRWNTGCLSNRLRLPRQCIQEARVLHWTGGGQKPWHGGGLNDDLWSPYAPRVKCDATVNASTRLPMEGVAVL